MLSILDYSQTNQPSHDQGAGAGQVCGFFFFRVTGELPILRQQEAVADAKRTCHC